MKLRYLYIIVLRADIDFRGEQVPTGGGGGGGTAQADGGDLTAEGQVG